MGYRVERRGDRPRVACASGSGPTLHAALAQAAGVSDLVVQAGLTEVPIEFRLPGGRSHAASGC